MALPENITVKQNKAGVTDLPWWFDLYHTGWLALFVVIWYFFGLIGLGTTVFAFGCLFGWKA